MLLKALQCGTRSLHNAALLVAFFDVICTSILLILFVLGSSLMLAFEIVGKSHNATRILDIVTDDVFGQVQASYNTVREKKDVAEDMGVWLIIMFLSIVDFIISCIFLDGVKSRNANKCQIWLNIRLVIIVVFKIVVLINLVYGTSWMHAIPDMIITVYRVLGVYIGYNYLKELHAAAAGKGANEEEKGEELSEEGKGDVPSISVSRVGEEGEGETRLSICSEASSGGIVMLTPPSPLPHRKGCRGGKRGKKGGKGEEGGDSQ